MIFEDPSRRRWKIVVASFATITFVCVSLVALSVASLITDPQLPQLTVPPASAAVVTSTMDLVMSTDRVSQTKSPAQWKAAHSTLDAAIVNTASLHTTSLAPLKKSGSALRSAFLLQQDSNSLDSFEKNAANLDVVFPDWFFTSRSDCTLDSRINPRITDTIEKSGPAIFARLTDGEGDTSYASQFAALLQNSSMRTCAAKQLAEAASAQGAKGILSDIESISPQNESAYLEFLVELKQQLTEKNLDLIVAIPSGNQAYDPRSIATVADAVLVIIHGEHYAKSAPGPLASQSWFEETLSHFGSIIPKDKLLVGIGSYGMDWPVSATGTARGTAQGLTYGEIMSLASTHGAHPELMQKSGNMGFQYTDEIHTAHTVWFLDAITAWNEWHDVNAIHALGIALWRLGSEDPNIWKFIGQRTASATALSIIPSLSGVYSADKPEIYHIESLPEAGSIALTQDMSGAIISANYTTLPTGYVRGRIGTVPTDKSVVLAFYGGPDPTWTPQIMDLLTKTHTPAIFFVYGHEAALYPNLMKEIAQRGFYIGNLGYDASTLAVENRNTLRSDVNTTQRLIEYATNRHSLLFAAPAPHTPEEASAMTIVQNMGYAIVSPNIYATASGLASDAFSQSILKQLSAPERHIIAFQTSDGASVLYGLQALLPALQSHGYTVSKIDTAINVKETILRPLFSWSESILAAATAILTGLRQGLGAIIYWLFLVTLSFSVFRVLFMSVFVLLRSAHTKKKLYRHPERIDVSVLIPAYNEAKTIEKTLRSLQGSSHTRFEALVIDDGSTDGTAEIVRAIAKADPRIRLIQKPNGGKASALNLGMRKAVHPIVVTIDADTILMPQAVDELIKPFADPRVDAVCGNVEVGNTHNLLTGFQTLEYITAQNFDRRAFEELNAINVVPGATGAWRRKHVLAIGGYESDTLTEDADLTIRMLADGGKIVCAPEARSLTEAPDKVRDLAKQRFRWSFGTFQCLGKHADLFFKGTVGWIALPNIFVFQILFPLMAPIGDIVFLVALIRGQFEMIFVSYIFFTMMDLTGSIFAFLLEKKPKRLMLFALIQRFFYRQFLYIIIIRAIIAMLRGQRYGWNKLQRTGTVAIAGTGTQS